MSRESLEQKLAAEMQELCFWTFVIKHWIKQWPDRARWLRLRVEEGQRYTYVTYISRHSKQILKIKEKLSKCPPAAAAQGNAS